MKFHEFLQILRPITLIILFIFSIIIIIVVGYDLTTNHFQNEKICKSLGFTESSSYKIEPGYVECCKIGYSDHIKTEVCGIFNKNGTQN